MPVRTLLLITASIVAVCISITAFNYLSTPRIAYVRNLELVYGYNGMKHAHEEYRSQTAYWKSNIDTLTTKYKRSLAYYNQHLKEFTSKEKEDQQLMLEKLQADINNYTSVIQQEAKSREEKLTQGVLNQINSFVQEYARKRGYDIVIGSDGTGTVLYGNASIDITDEVLAAINKEYKIPADTLAYK